MDETTRDALATIFAAALAVVFVVIVADAITAPRGDDCVYVQVVDCVCDINPCECTPTPKVVFVCDEPQE